MDLNTAIQTWKGDAASHAARGIVLPQVKSYLPPEFKLNAQLAMDAQPQLITEPNSAVPFFLTSFVDPEVIRIRFTPNKASEILGETKKGSWTDLTAYFHVVEATGEVSSYGDFNQNGRAGINQNWPVRQSYMYQVIKEYGELEIERAGAGRLNYVSEIDAAAASVMQKFENYAYFFGIAGLQNYGLLNDPSLSPALTPATKVGGGTTWFTNTGAPNATANEVYNDIVALYAQIVLQTAGLVQKDDVLVLAMSPGAEVALTFTNTFNVNVSDLLKKNFPKLKIVTAVQYGERSASNPQGYVGGNFIQMWAQTIDGQKVGDLAFSEKMRAHPIVRGLSSFAQKVSGGTWGAILKYPLAVAAMVGI